MTQTGIKKNNVHFEQALKHVAERGAPALEMAKRSIVEERIQNKTVREALDYYMSNLWFDVHHAGLLSIACEAVGGDPNQTTPIGAATILLRGGIDIHDDIIDHQKMKGSRLTVYGKYDESIALLAGNALLFKGFALLDEAIAPFFEEKRKRIVDLIKNAFFEIGDAVANEVEFRENVNMLPEDYYVGVIRNKAVGAEVHMKVGAIVGNGTRKEIEVLTQLGRTLGILATIRDEVIDMYEPRELQDRARNEILPLPILYASKNKLTKERINSLLKKQRVSQADAYEVLDLTFKSEKYQELGDELKKMASDALKSINTLENKKVKETLACLFRMSVEDI
jgi:geranylgeranyl pyrophosphate synthase